MSWSSGKDSAMALAEARADPTVTVTGLLTTVDADTGEVPIHGVPLELVRAQARSLGLPIRVVELPWPCPNDVYEDRITSALADAAREGVTRLIFGDLHLSDIREYRERLLANTALTPAFPLWGRDTAVLAGDIIRAGVCAVVTCVDTRTVPAAPVGRWFDHDLLSEFPPSVDPCGENGEFHTFVVDGPGFSQPVNIVPGAAAHRDGYAVLPLSAG
ncbi:MAG TPA: ATP-binding protein [Pseudonocardia sp.]|jgi:uncharacterized protein (TIGR00290 family)|nr:ATP-binding protein [Pseudonocardia sp.]